MNTIREVRAYLAGLIDGEGYVAVLPTRNSSLRRVSYEPVIKIGMTGETAYEVFRLVKEYYGGRIEKPKRRSTGGRRVFTYNLRGKNNVGKFVEEIRPYSIVKREQLILLEEFCNLPMTHPNHKNYDHDAYIRKHEIYERLKELKQPPATTE